MDYHDIQVAKLLGLPILDCCYSTSTNEIEFLKEKIFEIEKQLMEEIWNVTDNEKVKHFRERNAELFEKYAYYKEKIKQF